MEKLGERLLFHRVVPCVWATAMGEGAFVIRHKHLSLLKEDIEAIQMTLDDDRLFSGTMSSTP